MRFFVMNNGWIKLHRKLLDNPFAKKPNYLALWITLLLKANHEDNKIMWNGEILIIKEGQILTGRKELSQQTGIPESTIERILETLENGHQIEQQKTTKFRLITVINWQEHQKTDSKMDNKRTTNGQQTDTNKNDKNEKNDKNINIIADKSADEVNLLLKEFKDINPTINWGNKTTRKAAQDLIKMFGLERAINTAQYAISIQGQPYAPVITTPYQLKEKLTQLKIYYERQNTGGAVII